MITKFQHKLLLSFGLLIIIIITLVLGSVNSTIDSVSQVRIVGDLHMAQKVFEDFTLLKRKSKSESAASLIKSQPVLRAILGSGSATEDLFGEKKESSTRLEELNAKLYSTVEGLDLYQESQIFAITDESANLLFTKVDPKKTGLKLSDIPIVMTALRGNEVATRWGSSEKMIQNYALLPPVNTPTLFEVFIKPIVFGNEVKGLMIVGFPISSEYLADVQNVTRAKIAFLLEDTVYGSSEVRLRDLPPKIQDKSESTDEFTQNGETFISLFSPFSDSIGDNRGASIIYRSKSEELNFYRHLKDNLSIIGGAAILIALLLAMYISGRVTEAIRHLINGVNQIRKGNLEYEVIVRGKDELYQLAENFNLMTKDLKEKEHIKNTFKRYVSPKIVNTLLADANKLKLGGDKRSLIIYFADIVGFTTISEKLPPEQTIDLLNNYLSQVAALIDGADGVIDKFIGDAVMAYWLQTDENVNYEELVCEVALKHKKIADDMKAELLAGNDKLNFDVRIGIHKGDVIIGNIGSSERMDYTIIGDNVNLASRLESLNKQYGSHIIVSDEIVKNIKRNFSIRELDLVKVVGKSKSILIYELLPEAKNIKFAEFSEALSFYRSGNFKKSLEIFTALQESDSVALKFVERCKYLIQNPPANWDGSFQALEK